MATVQPRPPVDMVERLYTAADVASMPSDLPSGHVLYELDNGRLITMVPPGFEHGSIGMRIGAAFYTQGEAKGFGKVSGAESGVILWRNPDRVVGADVIFVGTDSLPIRLSAEGYLETIPDIVVEVMSKNDTKAYIERKVADYLKIGTKQVWIADPSRRTLTIHETGRNSSVLKQSDTLTLKEIIPGFSLKIADVFAD